ncbi:ankyrin repeat domain-containing protein [Legionella worsleiensis]|uniref:Ankyrin repeat protein n=2 Tax=Legionella worsleiensis TaxID=45076 RepID=A0A0W1AA90_9GAMM|nr:Ankyrin repeat protein [Legionella worsleiensis]STY32598.1 Ankyrin repeat protein [Legionella worsleiensis]
MQAARLGLLESVKLIIASKPQLINWTDQQNRTPLSCAIINGHINIVRFLIESGAQLDVCLRIFDDAYIPETPFNNCSPLDLARRLGNPDMIALLENAKAQPAKTASDRVSPLHFFAGSSSASSSSQEHSSLRQDSSSSWTDW